MMIMNVNMKIINEEEELNNIYEEDYIVNQIIQSQNGGKIEKKEENNISNEKEKINKERIQKKIKEKKLQFEQMKEAFMNLNINNHNKDDDENNINNENDNDENNINNNFDNDDEEYKNNSNSPKMMENGGKFDL